MIRVRFHGRGGQGMKTASRILGSAAFQAGYVVQDSPVYGAERRGAPMMSFTRISTDPILERGAIEQPDLVVVADDTLLIEPAAQPMAGCTDTCTLLINSTQPGDALAHSATHSGRILVADFTGLVFDLTHTLAGLSTALGVATGKLVGLALDDCIAGLEEELSASHLTRSQYELNLQLARRVYTQAAGWEPIADRKTDAKMPVAALHDVVHAPPAVAAPSIYAVANTPQRHTGSWRQFRPVLQPDKCSKMLVVFCLVSRGGHFPQCRRVPRR